VHLPLTHVDEAARRRYQQLLIPIFLRLLSHIAE
jgi:hypothetical protein